MNYLIILSGGTGTRIGGQIPKQYKEIDGIPIIKYTMKNIDCSVFEKIVLVVATSWIDFIKEKVLVDFDEKKIIFAQAGLSRQESVLHGLLALKNYAGEDDIVVIHDAARPNCKKDLFMTLINECCDVDGVMPIIPVKDTIYVCRQGESVVTDVLNRDELCIGQTPEAYKFGPYLSINQKLSKEELERIRGSSEIAYKSGLEIKIVEGDEMNFKITTPIDFERFIEITRRN